MNFQDFSAAIDFESLLTSIEASGGEGPVDVSGVVAAITAFNYPLYLNLRKAAHALAAGCVPGASIVGQGDDGVLHHLELSGFDGDLVNKDGRHDDPTDRKQSVHGPEHRRG
mgnify:CR=1 FL=1